MIKELRFTGIVGVLEKGASTKPILIEAEDEGGEVSQYVVKLYKEDYSNNHFAVGKEILISELAKEFDLTTPEYAVINFDHKLLKGFYDNKRIGGIHLGYKYCSKFMEGWVLYASFNSNLLNGYDVENVFAFDNLIINIDRGGNERKT